MSHRPRASSILEFLTARNPPVTETKCKDLTNSHVKRGQFPAQLVKWEDFNIQTLEALWDGDLFRAVHADRDMPGYPDIAASYLRVNKEEVARELIHAWNREIVLKALELVGEEYHPSIWSGAISKWEEAIDESDAPTDYTGRGENATGKVTNNSNKGKDNTGKGKDNTVKCDDPARPTIKLLRKPDGSAIAYQDHLVLLTTDSDEDLLSTFEERLPKEYKVSAKWRATEIVKDEKLFAPDGKWQKGAKLKNKVRPLSQIFTYCLAAGCRYGFIITCSEAFIFRIGLRSQLPDAVNGEPLSEYQERLVKSMREDALMEYIIVPWKTWYASSSKAPSDWTVNLALFFLHVLAGQSFEILGGPCPSLGSEPRPATADTSPVNNQPKRSRDPAEDRATGSPKRRRRHTSANPVSRDTDEARNVDSEGSLDEARVGGVPPSSSTYTAQSVSTGAEDADETARTEVYESSSMDSNIGKEDEHEDDDPIYSSFADPDASLGPKV